MKFGYILKHYGDNYTVKSIKSRAEEIDNSKFDSLWLTDHVLMPRESRLTRYNSISESITTMGYLAGLTTKMELGISTLVLPQRNPIIVAKQLATLHYFIGNRFNISFGAGWCEDEYKFLNSNFNNRGERFNEYLEVIRDLWNGETSFSGDYISFEDAVFEPREEGLSKIPIAVAGNSKYALKRARDYGDVWHPVNVDPHKVRKYWETIEGSQSVPIMLRLSISEDQPIEKQIQLYTDIGITHIILDDRGNNEIFRGILEFVSNQT